MIPKNVMSWCRFGLISLLSSVALVFLLGSVFWTGQSAEPVADSLTSLKAPEPEEGKPQTGLPEAHIAIGRQVYRVEVATTPKQSEIGLMYRTSLPEGHGMLFPFKPPHPVSFWMKNTKIPLDILFIANGRLAHAFQDAQPCLSDPCPTYGMRMLTDMVLELPAGTARHDRLTVGMPVELRWLTPAKPAATTGN